jgi:serine/threonine protein kinase
MPKKVGKYEIGKTLGEGTFGKVKYAVNTETGQVVAIKVLDKERIQQQNMGAQIKKEISIMKMVKHPCIVNLLEVLASRTKIFIVLEFIQGGELFDKIVDAGKFDEATARFYLRQLVNGVQYCHEQGVAHRDLKPENLLLDGDDNLKISDFGLSAFSMAQGNDTQTVSQLLHTTCGTPNYVAPEVLADKGYDGTAADVWSIGVILYVLLAGFLPFDEPTMSGLFRKIQKGEFQFPPWFTADARDLIGKILVTDPKQRLTLLQVKAHKWYQHGGNIGVNDYDPIGLKGGEGDKIDASKADPNALIREGVAETGSKADGPPCLNAFDLINLVGGLAFDHMLNYHEAQAGNSGVWRRYYSFLSVHEAPMIMKTITALINEDDGAEVTHVDDKTYTVSVSINNKSMVTMTIQVYVILSEMQLVEVQRGRGDILTYYKYLERMAPKFLAAVGPDSTGDGSK